MKDFYDVYQFVEKCEESILSEAIQNTFRRRQTLIILDHPVFKKAFYMDEKRLRQWGLFLERNELAAINFDGVYDKIVKFLQPIYEHMAIS